MDDDLLPDGEPASGDGSEERWERPVDRFRRTAAGSVLAAGMLGLAEALEGRPERERPAIMSEAMGARQRPQIRFSRSWVGGRARCHGLPC